MEDRWFDAAAGPVVRPYAMTRGRTRSSAGEARLDLIALVIAEPERPVEAAAPSPDAPGTHDTRGRGLLHGHRPTADERRTETHPQAEADTTAGAGGHGEEYPDLLADSSLGPEHIDIVTLCRRAPQSVAELAAGLDLPVGVIRVLVGDLIDAEWVRVSRPVPPAELPDESILREVIDGLRAL